MAKKPEEAQATTENQDITPQAEPSVDATPQSAKNVTADEMPPQPALESLIVLADRHRIARWQQAALMRCMGWENGKMVTDAEYRAALARLKSRPMGGGRLA